MKYGVSGVKGTAAAVVCAAASWLLVSGPALGATLEEELARLVQEHPRVLAARDAVTSADQGIVGAFANFLPKVQLSGDSGFEYTDSPALRASTGKSFTAGRARGTLTVTENLFDGFRSSATLRSAEFDKEVAGSRLVEELQNRMFEGASAYVGVLRSIDLVSIARQNEQTIKTQLELEDERVRRGAGISVDVLTAKSRLQLAKERRVLFEGQLETSVSRYIQVFDGAPDPATMVPPNVAAALMPNTLDEAVAAGLAEHPALATSNRQIDLASERRRNARADYFPQVDLVGRGNYEHDVAGIDGPRRDASILLQLNWELFSGFATQSNVGRAASDLSASRNNHAFVNRAVAEQVRIAWEGLLTARERQDLLENAVVLAQEVFDKRRELRDAGRETAIEVLDAETEVLNARINLTAADSDARISSYRLLLSMGRLTPDILGLVVAQFEEDMGASSGGER